MKPSTLAELRNAVEADKDGHWNALGVLEAAERIVGSRMTMGEKRRLFFAFPEAHPDDLAVDRFAAAMKAKLARKRAEGRGGWDNPEECSAEHLSYLLIQHCLKGDPLDVGNLAMMLHQRGDRIVIDDETASIMRRPEPAGEAEPVKHGPGCGSHNDYPCDCQALTAPPDASAIRGALVEVRSHLIVEYTSDGRIAGIGHDSEALPKILAILDAALSGAKP